MVSSRISVRIAPGLLRQFEDYLDQHSLTVSEDVNAAIASYIGDAEAIPLVERVR